MFTMMASVGVIGFPSPSPLILDMDMEKLI
uniref:Uncharacterized protein n=1 Tax=Podoviridae sp. ctsUe5 TaxID=2827750 RepID=A0A8S5S616_9CAUD|nr:MAG TPA: hypothetical protein [Podoviridae sp. ctsUe5]